MGFTCYRNRCTKHAHESIKHNTPSRPSQEGAWQPCLSKVVHSHQKCALASTHVYNALRKPLKPSCAVHHANELHQEFQPRSVVSLRANISSVLQANHLAHLRHLVQDELLKPKYLLRMCSFCCDLRAAKSVHRMAARCTSQGRCKQCYVIC